MTLMLHRHGDRPCARSAPDNGVGALGFVRAICIPLSWALAIVHWGTKRSNDAAAAGTAEKAATDTGECEAVAGRLLS